MGVNSTAYFPNVGGVDLTVGVRNLLAVVPGRLGGLGREDVQRIDYNRTVMGYKGSSRS